MVAGRHGRSRARQRPRATRRLVRLSRVRQCDRQAPVRIRALQLPAERRLQSDRPNPGGRAAFTGRTRLRQPAPLQPTDRPGDAAEMSGRTTRGEGPLKQIGADVPRSQVAAVTAATRSSPPWVRAWERTTYASEIRTAFQRCSDGVTRRNVKARLGRAPVAALLTTLLMSACALVYGGRYDYDAGWRVATVLEVALPQQIRGRARPDCRELLTTRDGVLFAFVRYNHEPYKLHRAIVPIPSEISLSVGERIYLNITDCREPLVRVGQRVDPNKGNQ